MRAGSAHLEYQLPQFTQRSLLPLLGSKFVSLNLEAWASSKQASSLDLYKEQREAGPSFSN